MNPYFILAPIQEVVHLSEVVPIKDIRQLPPNIGLDPREVELILADAMYRFGSNSVTMSSPQLSLSYHFEYGRVRGLRNLTPLAMLVISHRKSRRLTQGQLSAATGGVVTSSEINSMENHVYATWDEAFTEIPLPCSYSKVEAVCKVLNIPVNMVARR